MSTIPIQNLIIDDDTDIGLTSDLVNGNFKTSSLTDLSNNVYTKIFDLSSNLNTKINTKENRVAAAMPEGHCGGFGTSSRMRCGTLTRLGTRQRRPDNQGHCLLGSHSKSTTAIFSAPTGRLGCHRGSPREPQARGAHPRGTPIKSDPRAGPPATTEAPLARRTAAPPFTDSH